MAEPKHGFVDKNGGKIILVLVGVVLAENMPFLESIIHKNYVVIFG
jgi:hypothetical protein